MGGATLMSLLKIIRAQLGLSNTPAENHFWDGSTANQLKLKRGTPDAPGVDVMTIDAGKPDFNQLARNLGGNGSYELPGGLIIKWGLTTSATSSTETFSTAFPSQCLALTITPVGGASNVTVSFGSLTASGFTRYNYTANTAAGVAVQCYYIAIGK